MCSTAGVNGASGVFFVATCQVYIRCGYISSRKRHTPVMATQKAQWPGRLPFAPRPCGNRLMNKSLRNAEAIQHAVVGSEVDLTVDRGHAGEVIERSNLITA